MKITENLTRLIVNQEQTLEKYDYNAVLLETWESLPPYFITSSSKNLGGEEVLNYIDEINKPL